MRMVKNDADEDADDPATRRAAPEPAGDLEAETPADREAPMPEEEGYGYGV